MQLSSSYQHHNEHHYQPSWRLAWGKQPQWWSAAVPCVRSQACTHMSAMTVSVIDHAGAHADVTRMTDPILNDWLND